MVEVDVPLVALYLPHWRTRRTRSGPDYFFSNDSSFLFTLPTRSRGPRTDPVRTKRARHGGTAQRDDVHRLFARLYRQQGRVREQPGCDERVSVLFECDDGRVSRSEVQHFLYAAVAELGHFLRVYRVQRASLHFIVVLNFFFIDAT